MGWLLAHPFTVLGFVLVLLLIGGTVTVTALWLDHWHNAGRPDQPGWTINRRHRGAVYVSSWARHRRPTRLRSRTRAVLLHRAGVRR